MNQHPDYDLFTAIPQVQARANAARTAKNQETLKDYSILLREFERATCLDMARTKNNVSAISPNARLDASIHASVHRAKVAMLSNNATAALKSLTWVDRAKNPYAIDGIEVSAPDGSPACVEAITHMHQDKTLDVHGRRAEIFNTSCDEIAPYVAEILRALDKLKTYDYLMHEEMEALVHKITVFKAQAIMGGSLSRTFGAVFISSPDHDPVRGHEAYITHRGVPYFVEHLVHETSHNLLFGLMQFDGMVLNPVSERFSAPLRTDTRPMYGIFHAAFVVSRMLRVFKILAESGLREYSRLVSHFEPRMMSGIKVISEHGRLTEAGHRVFRSMRVCAQV